MKTRYQKDLRVLLFALLASASTMATLPHVDSIWTGVKDVYGEQDFGLHILRKAMLVALASQQGAQDTAGFDGRISEGGRLVWKTPGSSQYASWKIHGSDRRQGTGTR